MKSLHFFPQNAFLANLSHYFDPELKLKTSNRVSPSSCDFIIDPALLHPPERAFARTHSHIGSIAQSEFLNTILILPLVTEPVLHT